MVALLVASLYTILIILYVMCGYMCPPTVTECSVSFFLFLFQQDARRCKETKMLMATLLCISIDPLITRLWYVYHDDVSSPHSSPNSVTFPLPSWVTRTETFWYIERNAAIIMRLLRTGFDILKQWAGIWIETSLVETMVIALALKNASESIEMPAANGARRYWRISIRSMDKSSIVELVWIPL